jgi:DNA-binding transcriptional ArsR family regulator
MPGALPDRILSALADKEMTKSQLARHLNALIGSVSKQVLKLREKGYIEICRHAIGNIAVYRRTSMPIPEYMTDEIFSRKTIPKKYRADNKECGIRICEMCRFWSDQLAESDGHQISAICLCYNSAKAGTYTTPLASCCNWASAHLGSIDDPDRDPDRYR